MRTRSQSRSLADLPAVSGCASGYDACPGSERMMTRRRLRRLRAANLLEACAVSAIATDLGGGATNQYDLSRCCWAAESGRLRKRQNTSRLHGGQTEAATESEWRDWANLPRELIEEIAGRVLSDDVSEYLRFRSACKPWRTYTEEPRGLDARFRPRNWIPVSHCASPSRRSMVNVSSGARVEVERPELATHHYLGLADGLLLLCHKTTNAIGLLNPLTGALTRFPPIVDVQITALHYNACIPAIKAFCSRSEPRSKEDDRILDEAFKVDIPDVLSVINGAGIDDDSTSSSLPTLVLSIRRRVQRLICAKPGDRYWVSVHHGEQKSPCFNWNDRICFNSLLTFGGHCYVATPRGDLMVVDLWTAKEPQMVYVSDTVQSGKPTGYSYLVRSLDQRMLMVRFLCNIDLAHHHYEQTEMFTVGSSGISSRMELFEVDLARRQLIPLSGTGGNYAAFVGVTHSVMLSADKFPKLAADAVYLNHFLQRQHHLGMYYHFNDRRISPPKDLRPYAHALGRLFPCACQWELDDYLTCDTKQVNRVTISPPFLICEWVETLLLLQSLMS